ncbi:pirin family protein [Dongia sp.]|uniref:pirin family protein n=1 Tax=Dongia sp. TaxID=1977262 RepID=UPI0035B16B54
MTIMHRPADARGRETLDWLDSRHSFSFGHYYDPRHMGFRNLRVINDDRVAPGGGFPTHGHRDMEIVSYVVEGGLAHRDSTGGEGVLTRGDVQAMSAGTGVRHSEFNDSLSDPVRFLQIWIIPEREGLPAAYRQARVSDDEKRNKLRLIVSGAAAEGALAINQDVRIYASLLDSGAEVAHRLETGRGAWVQVVEGEIDVNGTILRSGDGIGIEDAESVTVKAVTDSEFLLFDLR